MADWGMKVSRQGYGVGTCSDNQLLFSSSFKMPVVTHTGVFYGTTPTVDGTMVTHNYGYYPAYYCFSRQGTTDHIDMTNFSLAMGTDSLRFPQIGTSNGTTEVFTYFVFPIDITTPYTAPIVGTTDATQGAITTNYGFKVSKDGFDVGTAALNDLAVFSGNSAGSTPVRNQIVHRIGTGFMNTGDTFSVAHGLGYAPMAVCYEYGTFGNFVGYNMRSVVYSVEPGPPVTVTQRFRVWTDGTNFNVTNNFPYSLNFSYMILKDPLL